MLGGGGYGGGETKVFLQRGGGGGGGGVGAGEGPNTELFYPIILHMISGRRGGVSNFLLCSVPPPRPHHKWNGPKNKSVTTNTNLEHKSEVFRQEDHSHYAGNRRQHPYRRLEIVLA